MNFFRLQQSCQLKQKRKARHIKPSTQKVKMSQSLISDSQKEFIVSSIKNDFRIDGRSNSEPQKYITKINNLDHLLGSCLVNIQTSQNEVHIYTGIKVKVEKQPATKNASNPSQTCNKTIRDRISLELGSIKKLTDQQQKTRLYIEQYLTKYVIDTHLSQFQSLLTIPNAKRHFLTLTIETYVLTTPHVSYLEYLHVCIKKAIQNIEMPQFTVAFNEITDEEVVEVRMEEVRGKKEEIEKNNGGVYQGLKAVKIVGVLGENYVVGMTAEEYEAVDSCLLVALGQDNNVVSFESLKGTLKVQELHQVIKFAKA